MKSTYCMISQCYPETERYDYHNIPDALCGRTRYERNYLHENGKSITPIRIRVIQMN